MDKSKVRILIVDDEEDILDALQTNFEMDGYHVEVAPSAAVALEKIKEHSFHIIMTDINMPQMDGIQLLEKVKQTRGDAIVIMITAYTSLMKVLSSRVHGAADYILKPFRDLAEIDEVVDRAYQQIKRWDQVLTETREVKKQKV